MLTTYAYELDEKGRLRILMPRNAKLLSVGYVDDQLYLFAEVDTQSVRDYRELDVVLQGGQVSRGAVFVGTVVLPNGLGLGSRVVHVYDLGARSVESVERSLRT